MHVDLVLIKLLMHLEKKKKKEYGLCYDCWAEYSMDLEGWKFHERESVMIRYVQQHEKDCLMSFVGEIFS